MTGLAGLTIGAAQVGASIIISDGNPDSVASIHLNIDRNLHVLNPPAVTSRQLLWGRDAVPSVDIVIGADCTFDCGMHLDLISTLFNAMSFPHGLAFLFVPSRGGSMASFILACETYSSLCFPGKGLVVDCQERYDDRVWFLHQQNSGMLTNEAKEKEYEPDKDYPFFLKLSWRV
ncbi:hypothetical protein BDR26DRAFT_857980 [Obelidium mucronatum]|nr:hypothetical protein BDR26DRAFT_857980 [Obelidium mucronatum]